MAKLLTGMLFDPSSVITRATTANLAMTAFDTSNLRLAFVVPTGGIVGVRIAGGAIHGATTFPQILLGVLEGATVKGRMAPVNGMGGTAVATTMVVPEAFFVVSGLTVGANLTWDVAYGVETPVAATAWKVGGPNNTITNDAFGGIAFEIWDLKS